MRREYQFDYRKARPSRFASRVNCGTAADRYEVLRNQFRPRQTHVLLIGESRPADGTYFFSGNSLLVRYTREAFEAEYGFFEDAGAFLECFKRLGCWLADLCPIPANHLKKPQRKHEHERYEPMLSAELSELKPRALTVVMKTVAPCIRRAAAMAGLEDASFDVLPFPAQGHQPQYVKGLRRALARFKAEGVLPRAC